MPKKIDHAQRRKLVIDVTMELILEGGLEAATMREIATRAGFANGALKHFFSSKDDIIQATYAAALEGNRTSVMGDTDKARDLGPLAALRAEAYSAMPDTPEKREQGRVLLAFWERAVSEPRMRDAYRAHLDEWRADMLGYLAGAREAGEVTLHQDDDEAVVNEIVLINAGFIVMGLLDQDDFDFTAQRVQLDSLFARICA